MPKQMRSKISCVTQIACSLKQRQTPPPKTQKPCVTSTSAIATVGKGKTVFPAIETAFSHKGYPVLPFPTQQMWRQWLAMHHASVPNGIFVQIYKKKSGIRSITYAEALDEALCFGWIDSVKDSYGDDGLSYVQRFSPRREKGSIWSQVNQQHVSRLVKDGRMTAAGQAAVGVAKSNGVSGQRPTLQCESFAEEGGVRSTESVRFLLISLLKQIPSAIQSAYFPPVDF